MGVYVDSMFACVRSERWPWGEACHLTADSIEELHSFGARLGLRRSWFQGGSGRLPHYDLTRGMRSRALRLGAEPIGDDEMVRRIRAARAASAGAGSAHL